MEDSPRTDASTEDEGNTEKEEQRTYAGDAAEAAEMIEAEETEGFVMVVVQEAPERGGFMTRTSIAATDMAVSSVKGVDYAMLATALHSVAEGNNVSLKRAAAKVLKSAREHGASRWG
jgi:hypothetical protein